MRKTILTVIAMAMTMTCTAQKYVGGDISMLTKYEEQHASYLDQDGKAITNLLTFLKEQGWNAMRVRLFVDPSKSNDKAVCQNLEYVKVLGKRIKDAGLNFMLDFHYSDTWADPGHQTMPDEFIRVNEPAFTYIYAYTKTCLEALANGGATPDFIQIGNEISFGMLWDVCKIGPKSDNDWTDYSDTNWDHLATALTNASKACREVCPQAKIIIHTEQCANNPTLDAAFFHRVRNHHIDYDIIGVSYYPYFKGALAKLDAGLTKLEQNFPDKKIQVVETGYPSKWEVPGTTYNYTATYPYSHEGQRKYTADLITLLNKHQQVNGLSWWYAEANAKGCTGNLNTGWYNASLFDNETGRALPALYELKNFAGDDTRVETTNYVPSANQHLWFTLDGSQRTERPSAKGLYIHHGKKVVVTH